MSAPRHTPTSHRRILCAIRDGQTVGSAIARSIGSDARTVMDALHEMTVKRLVVPSPPAAAGIRWEMTRAGREELAEHEVTNE